MMFDEPEIYPALDPQEMHAEIAGLPEQLDAAWSLGQSLPLPAMHGIDRVVVAGMGGSAIGSDLLRGLVTDRCRAPFLTLRDYVLPGWADGPGTLVIGSSHSGNTEETLAVFQEAGARGCSRMAVCTGGKLAAQAEAEGVPVWRFVHAGQPRAGVGFSFGLLLAAFARLNLVEDPDEEVAETVAALRSQGAQLHRSVPAVQNPAKRYAGQFMDRNLVIFGAEFLAPVARRWKTQVNELAKAWAHFEEIPEADHNALAGTEAPESTSAGSFAMFLVAPRYTDRNRMRMDLTRRHYMLEGVSTDFYNAQGESRMAQQWTALQFGDFVAYYLAIAYGIDPTPVDALVGFKETLAQA